MEQFEIGEIVTHKKTKKIGQILCRLDLLNSDLYRFNSYEVKFEEEVFAKLGSELEKCVDSSIPFKDS